MKVLIADVLPAECVEKIRKLGMEVVYNPDLGASDLPKAIKGINVLVVRSTEVPAAVVQASDALALVIRAGSGVNTIDTEACSKAGIFVSNCPGLNSVAVAELAMAHILSLDRNIPDCVADLRAGKWNKGKYSKQGNGLKGRTLGLIGFGNIGQEVAKRALAFEMRVVAYDPAMTKSAIERKGVEAVDSMADICSLSNVISIHVPFNKNTKGLIGTAEFARMQKGTFIINTSRGGVIDEAAFLQAAAEKGVRGGFDVFSDEPAEKSGAYTSAMAQSPAVYGTHHIGASTVQAQIAVAEEVVELLKLFNEGGHVRHCVNLETASRAKAVLVIRHYDRVGVLAEIFRILKAENVNVENMENYILKGQETACARIRVSKPLTSITKLTADPALKDVIIHAEMFAL
ncbi:MAG: phosphoglycerate dehydrogenase [Planctomycetota bacterium]